MGSTGVRRRTSYKSFANSSSAENANKYFHERSNYEDWINNKMTDAERTAVIRYTGHEYVPINNVARETKDAEGYSSAMVEKMKKIIKETESGLSKAEISDNIIVWRGTSSILFGSKNMSYDEVKQFEGGFIRDKGFMSSSPHRNDCWATDKSSGSNVFLKISVPKGTGRGAWVDPISTHGGEHEFLIQRNSCFKISKVTQLPNGGIQVEMTWIKSDKSKNWMQGLKKK